MKHLIVIILLLPLLTFGRELKFNQISVKDGLSDNSARGIFQDSKGYIWFSTLNGLDRYDGNDFKNYTSIPGDPNSLKNSRIYAAIEDQRGYIWCRTLQGNAYRLNPETTNVIDLFSSILGEEIPITNFTITSKGVIWMWGHSGCVRLSYPDDTDKLSSTVFNTESNFPNNFITFVFEDNNGTVWAGTQSGLVQFSESPNTQNYLNTNYNNISFRSYHETDKYIWFGTNKKGVLKFNKALKKFESEPKINILISNTPIYTILATDSSQLILGSTTSIFDINIKTKEVKTIQHNELQNCRIIHCDHQNNIWICAENRGVFKYDREVSRLKHYSLNAQSRLFLGDLDKQIIFEDSNKDLWIGIYGGGLFLYQQADDIFINYQHNEASINKLSSNMILSIFEDYSKNLWVGTMYGGLNKISLKENKFLWHKPQKDADNNFENLIRASVIDKNNNLWVGSKNGHIYCYDESYNERAHIPCMLTAAQQRILKDISIYSLYFDHQDNLWIGTKGKGIFIIKGLLNKIQKNVEVLALDQLSEKSLGLKNVYSITQDKYNQYWVADYNSGLYTITNPFENLQIKKHNIVNDKTRHIFIDRQDNLWLGTAQGISVLPSEQLLKKEKTFISITNDKNDIQSLSYNNVDYITQSSDGNILAATMGGGLNILEEFDFSTSTFKWKFYDKSNGLSSNKVFAITEDNDRNLWISTSYGINRINIDEQKIEMYFVENPQVLNYFSESCVSKLRNNEIIFGHSQGFISFDASQIQKDTTKYPIVLSKLFVNGIEVNPKEENILSKSIEFQNELHLKHWQNSFQLNFSTLDFSSPEKINYSYRLNGYNEKWSTPLNKNYAAYENLPHGKYTFQLKATNSDGIENSNVLYFPIVITPPFYKSTFGYILILALAIGSIYLFFLLYSKQLESKHKVKYANELNEKKLKYYTNISHEFKTPLTLILGPTDDIIEDKQISDSTRDKALQIRKNANYLHNLIEQILDFRKIREEKMQLEVTKVNIVHFVQQIIDSFTPLAEKKSIDLFLNTSYESLEGYIDCRIIEKVLFNLLSNALKFTSNDKTIVIDLIYQPTNDVLSLSIIDQGKGISKEELKRLFERFYRSENSSGIGLFFVKELITNHKGTVSVQSQINEGTTFTVSLPIKKSHYIDDIIYPSENETANSYIRKIPVEIDSNPIVNAKVHYNSILVIEDNEEMRRYICGKLQSKYNVFEAPNGKVGLEVALNKSVDIIICDLMMPVMDGIETTKNLRSNFNTSHIPIILLTANSSDVKKMEAIKNGANDYITKPFNYKFLALKIENLITQTKKSRSNFSVDPNLPANILTTVDQDKDFIDKVSDFIDKHLGDPNFSIEKICSELGYSRTNFFKKMRGVTGGTPHAFLQIIRMKKAAIILKTSNQLISDIAMMVGYSDVNYFSRSFKKQFGLTPKSYQMKHKENNN